MRKRIKQLASGKFEHTGPKLSLSTTKIELEVLEGRDATGEFTITSTNHVKMRGLIYSSNPRMECLTPQFEGEEVRIRYQFHSEGLIEGDIQKGDFFIVCNQGEYNLSFVASISKLYADSSIGKVKNLTDFAKLAKESFEEAYRIFYSKNFTNIIKAKEEKERLLYEGIQLEVPSGQKVEEYLTAIDYKKPVEIALVKDDFEFYEVEISRKEQLELRKNQWGYTSIQVSSDTEFLIPSKTRITAEDFLGSACFFEYYIDKDKMHAGRNYGRLTFEYAGGMLQAVIMATEAVKLEEKASTVHREITEGRIQLMQLYMDYRLKKIVTGVWAKQSIAILDHFIMIEPREELYPLMKAQALIINRQRQEASWILDDFKRECIDRSKPIWGYYLYLCTLMEREESYVDRLTSEIEELFRNNPKSSLLFWVLLFVKEEYYRNGAKRLKALEQWIENGNDSPYFYLEAYYLIWQDPYLLVKLGKFELKILNWARKQNALSKDIALQILNLLSSQREYELRVYKLLCSCYEVNPSEEMLSAICSYLIKGQKLTKEYHKWYQLGIEQEIRITNLYEAFLISMDKTEIDSVPKVIQMYFQYHNHLSYRQLAVLYVNIIAGKEKQPEVYHKYRRTIEQFAMEQIEAGRMDDNLAVIYDDMLQLGFLNEELACHLSKLLFTHKLTCPDKKMTKAVIIQKQLKQYQVVSFVNQTAYFQAYSKDYCVVLVDTYGNCYAQKCFYQDEPLLRAERYMKQCLELAPEELPYLIQFFARKERYTEFHDKQDLYFPVMLQSDAITDNYRAELLPAAIDYYSENHHEESMEQYLKKVEFRHISPKSRILLVELLAELHLYEEAYYQVEQYGYEKLGSAARVALCSYEITRCGFEEDDFLLGFAETTFFTGKYNDVMLIYLCKFYQGPTKQMAKLWKAAGKFEIDTFDLEERIITQMLYSTDYVDCIDDIYDSYYSGGGRELVCMAYLSYFSHYYLVNDMLVAKQVFLQIEERLLVAQELNDACKLGLMKYYSEQEKLTEAQRKLLDGLLLEYTCKNMYFSFYKKYEKSFILKYHFYDKSFIEYHTKPGRRVILHYTLENGEYQQEDMTEGYDGIYVKRIILFFGETLQYYVSEEEALGKEDVAASNQISNNDMYSEENQSRYALLNDMLLQAALQENAQLKRAMKSYHGMKTSTEQIFTLL